jgi:hypothetical protein
MRRVRHQQRANDRQQPPYGGVAGSCNTERSRARKEPTLAILTETVHFPVLHPRNTLERGKR